MKIQKSSLIKRFSEAAFAATLLAMLPSVNAQSSWDGGSASSNSWGNATNWVGDVLPTFGTTADLTFNNLTRPDNDLGAARIVRSLSYGSDIDGAFLTNTRTFNGGAATTLTFQAASGNASIIVDAGSTGNVTLGWNGVGTAGGSIILGSNLDVTHNGSGVLLFNRNVTGTGTGITKLGSGTMNISAFADNSFSGAANVNAGRLIMGNTNTASASADFLNASAINLGGGTLEMRTTVAVNKVITNNMTVSTASTLAFNNTTAATRSLTLNTGSMALNANLTVQNISSDTTLANQIIINRAMTGAGDLIVDGYNTFTSSTADFAVGRVALGGNNTGWSGDLVIRQGSAQIFGDTAVGGFNAGTGTVVIGETGNSAGAAFLLAASTPTAGGKTLSNEIIVRSGGFRTIRGSSDHTYNINGNITLEGDLNIHNGLFFTDKNMILNGNISGVGGLSITESGNPNFTRLTGNNTYTGSTTVGAGAHLNILSASGNGIGDTSAVTLAAAGAQLNIGNNETIGSLASSGTDGFVNVNAFTLTTGGTNASTSYGGTSSGTGGITKVGNGTMTFTSAQGYTGATTVSSGTLLLASGATLASTNISVSAGATLNVSALGGGLVIGSGSRIGGDGTVTGDLSLGSGALFVFTLGSTLDVSGAVSLDNSFSIASLVNADGSAIDWSTVGLGTYTLINNASDLSNIANFGSGAAADLGGGKSAYFSNGSLQLNVIPEPATWLLLSAGLTTLAVRRRRRANGFQVDID